MPDEKEAVAIGSMIASALMTIGKFAVGMMTGSLAILSEAAHSLLDLGATVLTYMAVRISGKPADERHPYGHGKVESVSALIETGLLFLTSAGIVYEAAERLMGKGGATVEVTWWSIGVIVASIVIDVSRVRVLTRVAKKTRSQALEADALHFRSDVLSSSVVLVGLGCVAMGWQTGDAVAAIGVAVFVCRAGWSMGRRTIDTLIDTAPEGSAEKIRGILAGWPAIIRVRRVRVRPAGQITFVDVDVAISRSLPLNRVSRLSDEITEAIRSGMPEAEVTVSTHPEALDNETAHQRVAIIAAGQQLPIHNVTIHRTHETLSVGLDMEVDGRISISAAHEISDDLERSIRAELGEDVEVETHIDPLQTRQISGEDVGAEKLSAIHAFVQSIAANVPQISDVHAVRARETDQGTIVLFHCHVDPSRSVIEIHEIIDELERRIKQKWPEIWRVVGHAEPDGE